MLHLRVQHLISHKHLQSLSTPWSDIGHSSSFSINSSHGFRPLRAILGTGLCFLILYSSAFPQWVWDWVQGTIFPKNTPSCIDFHGIYNEKMLLNAQFPRTDQQSMGNKSSNSFPVPNLLKQANNPWRTNQVICSLCPICTDKSARYKTLWILQSSLHPPLQSSLPYVWDPITCSACRPSSATAIVRSSPPIWRLSKNSWQPIPSLQSPL